MTDLTPEQLAELDQAFADIRDEKTHGQWESLVIANAAALIAMAKRVQYAEERKKIAKNLSADLHRQATHLEAENQKLTERVKDLEGALREVCRRGALNAGAGGEIVCAPARATLNRNDDE